MRNLLLCIISGIFISINIFAQTDGFIQWNFHSKELGNNEFVLTFDAQVEEGWYLYSQNLEGQTPRPTKIELEKMTGNYIQLTGIEEEGELIEYYDTAIEKDIKKFANRVKFKTTVKTFTDKVNIAGKVNYMICNDTECLPPTSHDFAFKLLAPVNKPEFSVSNKQGDFKVITNKAYAEEGYRSNDGKMIELDFPQTVHITKDGIQSTPKLDLPEYRGGVNVKNEEKTIDIDQSMDLLASNMGKYMVREPKPAKKKRAKPAPKKKAEPIAANSKGDFSLSDFDAINWTFNLVEVSKGIYEIVGKGLLEKGWYMYAESNDAETGPMPLKFDVEEKEGIEFLNDWVLKGDKKPSFDKAFGKELDTYTEAVTLTRRVKFSDNVPVVGSVKYMTCNGERYMLPKETIFNLNNNLSISTSSAFNITGWWWILGGALGMLLFGITRNLLVTSKETK